MNAKGISVAIGANLAPLQRDFGQALAQGDRFQRSLAARLRESGSPRAALPSPASGGTGGGADPASQANDLAGAIAPLAVTIGTSLQRAMAPMASFASRFGAQFDRVGGTIITLARRVDDQMKFPRFDGWITGARAKVQALAVGSAAQVSQGAKAIDGSLAGVQGFTRLKGVAAQFGTVAIKSLGTVSPYAKAVDVGLTGLQGFNRLKGNATQFASTAIKSLTRVTPYAKAVDAGLAGLQGFNRLRHFALQFGDVASKSIGKLTRLKAPDVNFSSSTRSITNFHGAAQAATNGLKGFASQAALAIGVGALGYKAVDWLKDGVKGAMDLGETLSKTKEVFGANTGAITAQADQMASAFGISKQVSLDAASSFGLIAKAGGLSDSATADLANNFTKLAADVSSFYNIPVDQALEKMRSGLVGEAEPMRALGVLLSEDAVKAEAWRSGLAKSGAELTDQQKVVARAALIQQGLKTATGDLERTQDSASNQARKFTGSLANLATDVGSVLLPALQSGLGLLNRFGTYLGAMFSENKGTLQSWGASLAGVFGTVGDLFSNLPLVFEIGRLTIVQGLLNLGEQFDALGPNVVRVAQWIGDNWYHLIVDAVSASLSALKNFGSNVTSLGSAIGTFLADPTRGFQVEWTPLLDGFKSTVSELPALLQPKLTDMTAQIAAAKAKLGEATSARLARESASSSSVAGAAKGTIAPDMGESRSMTDLKEQGQFMKKLKDDIKSPQQKYNEGMNRLYQARRAGELSDSQFERAKQEVAKDSGMNKDVKFSGAMAEGSKEGYSSVISALTGRGTDLSRSSALTATNTARIAANTRPGGASVKKSGVKVANFA